MLPLNEYDKQNVLRKFDELCDLYATFELDKVLTVIVEDLLPHDCWPVCRQADMIDDESRVKSFDNVMRHQTSDQLKLMKFMMSIPIEKEILIEKTIKSKRPFVSPYLNVSLYYAPGIEYYLHQMMDKVSEEGDPVGMLCANCGADIDVEKNYYAGKGTVIHEGDIYCSQKCVEEYLQKQGKNAE